MKKRHILIVCSLVLTFPELAWTQQVVLSDVKARFSKNAADRVLVDKDAELIVDDTARHVIVKNDEHPLNISYDDIQRIVFDVSTHMRGGVMGQLVGGLAGAAISSKKVQDYWCYLEYKGPDGTMRSYMLEISKELSSKVIEKMQAVFGAKVTVAEFAENEAAIKKETLKDLQSKHDLKVDKRTHPMPELKPEKALVVIVCPPLAARNAGKGNQFKLHANDRVVAVNKMGTYSFAYLDPGDYLLVSQTENASGLRMNLEAGKDYYFLQDTFMGAWKARTALSRHTKELVMYELNGAHYADWKRK
ncbi:MAG: hypothetical protein A3H97_20545 [Acidobacteria bacterium RIFCSPLOWO2_02_FULL_65_29]|nr:MAG: hypothetical protein A3H97_20545 [Acidobacteria bacterium RIFCSPLOWO2_02_FULL_65_29]